MDPRHQSKRWLKKQNRDKAEEKLWTSSCSLEALKSKHLYLCTAQLYFNRDIRWVVHRIKMSDVLSSTGSENFRLNQVATESGHLPFVAGCGVFKSTILIGGGVEIERDGVVIEMDEVEKRARSPPLSKRMFSVQVIEGRERLEVKPFLPPLIGGKETPLLLEIKGELYAIDGDQLECGFEYERFERFDEKSNQWEPLKPPPIWDRSSPYFNTPIARLTTVITDSSILLSRRRQTTPIFRFDFTSPDAGWSETMLKYFPFDGTTLVHNCPHGFIISAIDVDERTFPTRFPRINVYRMSNSYDALNLLGTMELPLTDHLPQIFMDPIKHTFLDLGDQRVGLVLTVWSMGDDHKILKFLVATFQYKLSPFSYQCLSKPVQLEYDVPENPDPLTDLAQLMGAFVL